MKLKKDVIWIGAWIGVSTFMAFMSFSICVDTMSRFVLGILGFFVLLGLYGIDIMIDYKSEIMPINKNTLYYFSTMFYMLVNILALAYRPHILISFVVFILAIIPKPIPKFFDE